jgi:hypothetical protein
MSRPLVVVVPILLAAAVATAAPPDSETNPVSGLIETADSFTLGAQEDVRHTVDPGQGQPLQVVNLSSSNSNDDLDARLTINATGDTYFVWWRDLGNDVVLLRRRTCSGSNCSQGSWSTEIPVSQQGDKARHPAIVHDGTDPWVAYEYDSGSLTALGVVQINEDPDPIPSNHFELATTSFGGDVDVMIHAEAGNLWVTWVHSTSAVGWSEYDYATATWSEADTESYEGNSVAAARGEIRTTVLGN